LFHEPEFEYQRDISFRLFKNTLERGFGLFLVDSPFFLAHLEFVDTLEVGVEEVVERVEGSVDGLESGQSLVVGEAAVVDCFTEYITVFLLNEGVVVFVILAASSEGDVVGLTPVFRVPVDEFGPVIAVQAL
jgi:hypothetical protein